MTIKKAIILAGGEGSRLLPLTLEIPKPLITIKKKPLINYNVDLFLRYGIENILVIIKPSHRKDYDRWLAEHEKEFSTAKIEIVEESEPMGTFGYIFNHLGGWMWGGDIFVTNGDDIKTIDLGGMAAFHARTGRAATVALMRMDKPDDYGTVLVEQDSIIEFLEKTPQAESGLVSAGMYILSLSAIEHVRPSIAKDRKVLSFEKDFFPSLAKAKKLGGFFSEGKFYDCGTFERWEQAIREV